MHGFVVSRRTRSPVRSDARGRETRGGRPIALVLALAVVTLMMAGCGSSQSGTKDAAGLTGVDWVLVSTHSQQGSASSTYDDGLAYIRFQDGNTFTGNDGLNQFQGSFNIDQHTLTIESGTLKSTAEGTAVDDPRIEAMNSVIVPNGPGHTAVASTFSITAASDGHPSQLRIESSGWTLTFQQGEHKAAASGD